MRLLRTLPTRLLVLLIVAALALVGATTAIAVAATGGGSTPPDKPLDQAIHDALAAPEPAGVTARVAFTNKLFPSGALLGNAGSALTSSASGRLWATNDGRGRLELQSDAGDLQIVWNKTSFTVYNATSNTVYRGSIPVHNDTTTSGAGTPPTLTKIGDLLNKLGGSATISPAQPTDIAGQPAYEVSLAPKHDGGLLAEARVAWDADHPVPLRISILAQGSSSPVLELTATDISYGPVSSGDVEIQPPADAKVVDVASPGKEAGGTETAPVTGLGVVQAAAGFPVIAPDTLVGLPRQDVRLVGPPDSRSALVVYGRGLGAIVVLERKAEATAPSGGALSSLPAVSLDGVTAHELATQLGTALEWRRDQTSYVLVGSLPAAAAEAAARQLK